ncbi:MAG: T9SS type A sorting domain-containing protein [Flavobacteriales bacterium]|nr:T9SS type A sorting domain-containing protein [Flavobacteriales bacterium]
MRKLYSFLFSFIFISSSFAQVPTYALVSEWLFDNSSITNGSSSLLATLGGSPVSTFATDRLGNPNSAVNVDPGGFINFGGDQFDNYTTGASATFTLSFWIKLDAFNSTAKCIFAKASFETLCNTAGRQFAVMINSQQRLQMMAFGSLTGGNHVRIDGNTVITVGQWHHIVISVDMATILSSLPAPTGLAMYVDGLLQTNSLAELNGAGVSPSGIQDGPAHFGFGTYLNTSGTTCAASQDIDAHFDDFRLYNRIIAAQEVTALLNDGCSAPIITTQPQNLAACTGTSVNLNIILQEEAYIQWQQFINDTWTDVGQPEFAIGRSLDISTPQYAGLTRFVVTSECGAVTISDEVTVAIGGPAYLQGEDGPNYQTYLCAGATEAELRAGAIGQNITYRWFEFTGSNWAEIPNEVGPTLSATEGSYYVIVNACFTNIQSLTFNVENATFNPTISISSPPNSSNITICAGGSVSYAVNDGGGVGSSLLWSPGGMTYFNPTIYPTETTTYTVTTTSAEGCSVSATTTITVNGLQPTITNNAGTLEVSGGPYTAISWRLNGTGISGATFPTYTPVEDGNYTVWINQEFCFNTSEPYAYTGVPTGIDGAAISGLKVYPNPFNTEFVIETAELTTISVMNAMGEVVLSRTINGRTSIDATSLSAGIYFVREETSGAVMKLVKN